MSRPTLSHGETYGPGWAGMARNTGGSCRPVNKQHQTRPQGWGATPFKRSGGWRLTHGRGLYQEHGGYPARG